jgi:hypothetical protein
MHKRISRRGGGDASRRGPGVETYGEYDIDYFGLGLTYSF